MSVTVISEQDAIERAKRLAQDRGWAWQDPANATLRRRWLRPGGRWEIISNAHALGAKVRVVLDAESGHVLEQGYVPR